jgi:hypothetical protein
MAAAMGKNRRRWWPDSARWLGILVMVTLAYIVS